MSGAPRVPWLIRIALLAFPRAFRESNGAEMEEDFAEARAQSGTRADGARLVAWTTVDLVASGLRERRAASRRSPARSMNRKGSGAMDQILRDVRHAVRALVRRPGFSAVAVLTLALGIGANTAIFSVVNAVLLRPLAWAQPDGLVRVWTYSEQDPDDRGSMSLPDIQDVADLPAVEGLAGVRAMTATVVRGDEPEPVTIGRTTDGLMRTFRVQPVLGRDLTAADEQPGSPNVVVVGYRYWQDRLGGGTDVLGSTLQLGDVSYEIVGVAPAGFDFPESAQLWVPWQLDTEGCGRGCHAMHAVGRLAGTASMDAFAAQLVTLSTRLADEHPTTNTGKRFRAVRLADDEVADVRRALWFILGAVSLLLLIACANVANLLLVRGESRRGEVAVRAALGASRTQLASQVLMESAVLALAGAMLGLGLARASIGLIRRMPAGTVPRIETVSLDTTVLLFTLGLAVAVTLLFGLIPALRQARGLTAADLISDRRGGSGPRASRSRSLLLAAEVALSVVLLVGAGLLLKSFDRLYSVELGFGSEHVTRFHVQLPESRYDSISQIVAFYESLEEQLAALPGVVAVGSAFGPPLGRGSITADVAIEGRPAAEPGAQPSASIHPITAGYFTAMQIPLLRGRAIERSDRTGTLAVAVVSESFAKEYFPGEDAIGKRFEVSADFGYGSPVWTIVGIAGDVRRSPTAHHEPSMYVPLGQYGPGGLTVAMRTAGRAGPPLETVRGILRTLDPRVPVMHYETVHDAKRAVVAPARFYLIVMTIFAALAVTLACVGLYGVVAYVVSRRGREIGIRMALGAGRDQVVGMMLAQGLRPAAAGVVAGLALALALGRVAESLLFEVDPRDPFILLGAVGLLMLVAFAATLLPARRASRVDPARALREQ